MELQQVSSKDKEKTMLDRQHEHLIRCLEKATVSRDMWMRMMTKMKFKIRSAHQRPNWITTIVFSMISLTLACKTVIIFDHCRCQP